MLSCVASIRLLTLPAAVVYLLAAITPCLASSPRVALLFDGREGREERHDQPRVVLEVVFDFHAREGAMRIRSERISSSLTVFEIVALEPLERVGIYQHGDDVGDPGASWQEPPSDEVMMPMFCSTPTRSFSSK
jgi:hypothetical protein